MRHLIADLMEKYERPALIILTLAVMIPFAIWVAPYIAIHYGLAGTVIFVLGCMVVGHFMDRPTG